MKIEIAKHERMSESGSSLMRLIQNNELPTLDLLVRESIQNSSDAAKTDADRVQIDFNIKRFQPSNVNKHFDGISDNLDKRSSINNNSAKLLEIRDMNTTGLVGPLNYEDAVDNNFGNLINLIYEISRPQQKEGAGGSWGLGKTVYFRIGIGLVIYYTRIKNEQGKYESRLAACLIEDEKSKDAMLPSDIKGPKRGIAWWGQRLQEDGDVHSSTIPLTDEVQIRSILRDFNIEEFKGSETGTAIVIPYINEDKLIKNAQASAGEKHWWTSSMEDYLMVAAQRWYAPRIMNRSYPFNLPLIVSVNSNQIRPEKMLPVFKTIQDLYNMSSYSLDKSTPLLLNKDKVNEETIVLRTVYEKNTSSGVIVFTKLSKEELLMVSPANNSSPLQHTNAEYQEDADLNPPLICYLRKPGMIVNYDASGSWVKNISNTSKDEYIIGLFIPNSENKLKDIYGGFTLEEYLRKSEKADHTSWSDWTIEDKNPQIVTKIKGHVGKKINTVFKDDSGKKVERKNASIGKALAEILLPPENFGSQSGKKEKKSKKNKHNSKDPRNKSNLTIIGRPVFSNSNITIPFSIVLGSKVNNSQIELKVISEGGDIEANKWEEENTIGSAFPLVLQECEIGSIKVGNSLLHTEETVILTDDKAECQYNSISFNTLRTGRYDVPYGVNITCPDEKVIVLDGSLCFKPRQSNIQGSLTSKDIAGDEK
jgi:hypothetical protein